MVPWWTMIPACLLCAFFGMMVMALLAANGRDDK